MRFLLVAALVAGMTPGLGEVAESVVHLVASGHLAHSDAAHGDHDGQGGEHGCSTTDHLCGCCASQVVTAPPPSAAARLLAAGSSRPAAPAALASLHEPAPPSRPPIAS